MFCPLLSPLHRLQISQECQARGKSCTCVGFYIWKTLLFNISWIGLHVSCLKVRNSTNFQTNCEATPSTPGRSERYYEFIITCKGARAIKTWTKKKHFRRLGTIVIRTYVSNRLGIETVVEKLVSSRTSGIKTQ